MQVRYSEVDRMGVMHHAHYPHYYEFGRTELFASLGIRYADIEDKHGIFLPVVSMECNYIRPARYEEVLTINTDLRKWTSKFIYLRTEILNSQKKLLNVGKVKLCFVDAETRKSIEIPNFLNELLTTKLGAQG